MKIKIALLLALLSIANGVAAQNNVNDIIANGGTVSLSVSTNSNTIHLTLTGTWTGTLAFEYQPFNSTTYAALTCTNETSFATATGATSNGNFACLNINFNAVRVRASAFSSGTATVAWRATSNGALTGLIFGGGSGGTIGTVNQGTASATEQWLVNCVTGCAAATSDVDDGSIAVGQTNSNSNSLNMVYNGTAWVRSTGDATNGMDVDVTRLPALATGSNVIGDIANISGTITLPTGAATAAKQPSLGTAGTASTNVLTVQGIASMTPLLATVTNAGTFSVQCSSGCSGGTSDVDDGTIASGQTTGLSLGLNQVFDGTNWKRFTVGTAGTASSQVLSVQGIASGITLHVTCDSGCSSSTAPADNSAFTAGTTSSTPISGFYQATPSALTDGRIGAVGLTATRAIRASLEAADGTPWVPSTDYTHDTNIGTVTSVTGPMGMLRASAAAPTAVSADDDAVMPWSLRNGSQVVNLAAGSTLLTATSTSLNVNCTAGCSGGTTDTDDGSIATGQTIGLSGALGMVYDGSVWRRATIGTAGTASAQVMTIQGIASMTKLLVTPDSVALPANQSVNISQINAVTPLMGNGVTGTGSPRVTIASDNTAFTVNLGTAGSDPFGANADAASATGSISAKLRFIAGTGIPITGTVTVGSHAVTNAGTFAVQDSTTTLGCYLISAASTNSTNCKASAGSFYGVRLVNTTATLYYLRLYNASSAPTCSSATGFIETIPVPASTTGAGVVAMMNRPIPYGTGIGFCFTGGSSSTDNTNAATGVFGAVLYN